MTEQTVIGGRSWLSCLRRYVLFLAAGNLLWEAFHMPFYRLWNDGSATQIIVFGLHCVGGDVLIGTSSLIFALIVVANSIWPSSNYWQSAIVATLMGVVYTLWSEWYNVSITGRWAYSDAMPIIPVFDIGVTPLAQWLVVPVAGFWWARR